MKLTIKLTPTTNQECMDGLDSWQGEVNVNAGRVDEMRTASQALLDRFEKIY